jgi:hypothetical protein
MAHQLQEQVVVAVQHKPLDQQKVQVVLEVVELELL